MAYADMQARIADEVLGTGAVTATHITNAIQDAIRRYERQRFWFNEMVMASVTVVGQELYAPPVVLGTGAAPHIDRIMIAQNVVNRYKLRPQTPEWMDEHSVSSTWRGMPTDWSYYQQQVRLYPIPDNIYPLTFFGTYRFLPLVAAADTNAWMVEAEELIRMAACGIIYRRIVRDNDLAQMAAADEEISLKALQRETTTRGGPRRMNIKSWF